MAAIETAAKRARLRASRNPYWRSIAGPRGGVSLGYRTPGRRGGGAWIAKLVIDGRRFEAKIAEADDAGAAPGALPYPAAVTLSLQWSRERVAEMDAASATAAQTAVPTVRSAVEGYVRVRKARHAKSGRVTEHRLTKYITADEMLASLTLAKLTAADLLEWRIRLPEHLAVTTVNRLLNDVRAALNAAADHHRATLPGRLPAEIRAGTKKTSAASKARRQVLGDAEIRRLVEAAFAVDASGDFGRLVLVGAATGARFSQLARITVADFQTTQQRLMVPTSHKGKPDKPVQHIAVPIGPDVADRLLPIVASRAGHEPLLQHWSHKAATDGGRWQRHARVAWSVVDETRKLWKATVEQADLPATTIMLALRHSSIVRSLRAGLPVRLVGALHDTSVAMIEQHYAAFIVDATEELVRRAVMPLSSATPTALPACEVAE